MLTISRRGLTNGCDACGFDGSSSLRTQGPIRRGLSFRQWSKGLSSLLMPGVMGPCVRRDDPLRACTRTCPHQRATQKSVAELLAQNALLQAVAGIEQHPHRDGLVGEHLDAADIARLVVVGDGGDRPLVALQHL